MNLVKKRPNEFQPIITANQIKSRRRHSKSPIMRHSADYQDSYRVSDLDIVMSDKENVTPWNPQPITNSTADKLAEIENSNNTYKQKMKEISQSFFLSKC